MIILGVDPGVNGAITVYCTEKRQFLHSMNYPTKFDKNNKKQIWVKMLYYAVNKLLLSYENQVDNIIAVLEKVHAMPAQGVSTTFSFGRNFGIIDAIINCALIESNIYYVRPVDWKRKFNLFHKPKAAAKQYILENYPEAKALITRADQADAALIALYGAKYLC